MPPRSGSYGSLRFDRHRASWTRPKRRREESCGGEIAVQLIIVGKRELRWTIPKRYGGARRLLQHIIWQAIASPASAAAHWCAVALVRWHFTSTSKATETNVEQDHHTISGRDLCIKLVSCGCGNTHCGRNVVGEIWSSGRQRRGSGTEAGQGAMLQSR